jgi:putative intracellular protease/amidase
MLASLRNASEDLAAQVAHGLNMPLPEPMPLAIRKVPRPEVSASPTLSLLARPGDGSIAGRKVVLLVADGIVGQAMVDVHAALLAQGAVPRFAAPRIGPVATADGVELQADASLENEPGFLFDALVVPDGEAGLQALMGDAHVFEFVRDQFRHCKPILVLGAGIGLLHAAGWRRRSGRTSGHRASSSRPRRKRVRRRSSRRWARTGSLRASRITRGSDEAGVARQARHSCRLRIISSRGRSSPMKTRRLSRSPSGQAGPSSWLISWCTPCRITLRSWPATWSTPL